MTESEAAAQAGESIDVDEVLRRLPHRYPFLLIDRAVGYEPFKSIRAIKCVTVNEPFFPGHFPDAPVMPGVLQIEAMAQAGALLMSKSLDVDVSKHTIFFMSIENARFRRVVKPGDVLELDVTVLFHRRNIFKFRGRGEVAGELAVEAEFAAMKADR
ncbi:MAG: 3-hydroxyacyl-ACP dehydratase FabZ [Hyphomonadaceae bacterium]